MIGKAKTFRIAIGLFNEIRALEAVLDDLADEGLAIDSLCLVAGRDWPDRGDGAVWFSQRLGELIGRGREFPGPYRDVLRVAAGNDALAELCARRFGQHDGLAARNGWLNESQFDRLCSSLAAGDYILLISSETPEQQDASSRILLRHSGRGVQTHDFTARV